MKKIALTINKNYCPTWTTPDAVRELFQNGLDQETVNPDNKFYFDIAKDEGTIVLVNKESQLELNTLLLGTSTKADDESTIGQFGEGYKIATLVLLREGKSIVIYNRRKKEVWRPRFVNSRSFGQEILTFEIENESSTFFDKVLNKKPSGDLVIEVTGLTKSDFEHIIVSNLHIQNSLTGANSSLYRVLYDTKFGEVITGEYINSGDIFVNGLFVCNTGEKYKYAYNFKSKYLKLDRDRKMVSDLALGSLTATIWVYLLDTNIRGVEDEVFDMLVNYAADVSLFSSGRQRVYNDVRSDERTSKYEGIANVMYDKFIELHGKDAVPIVYSYESYGVIDTQRPVVVSSAMESTIRYATSYVAPQYTRDTLGFLIECKKCYSRKITIKDNLLTCNNCGRSTSTNLPGDYTDIE